MTSPKPHRKPSIAPRKSDTHENDADTEIQVRRPGGHGTHHPVPAEAATSRPHKPVSTPVVPQETTTSHSTGQRSVLKATPPPEAATAAHPPVPSPDSIVAAARTTLLETLFKEVGENGSLLDHPLGQTFNIRSDAGEGAVHTNKNLMVPLGEGRSVSHPADLLIELEHGGTLFVDIVDAHGRLDDLKAKGFDAIHLKSALKKPFGILIFVRAKTGGVLQEQAEAIAHGYAYVFGIDEENVVLPPKFAACKSEILKWLSSHGA